jgi:hypothetical protein
MDPDLVAGEALGELIATAVIAVAGRIWEKARGTPEGRAVKAAIGTAVIEALRASALPPGRAVDDTWLAEMEKAWSPAFTTKVSQQLVRAWLTRRGKRRAGSLTLPGRRWKSQGVT